MRQMLLTASLGSVLYVLLTGSAVITLFVKELGGSDLQAMLPASFVILSSIVQLPITLRVPPGRGKRFMIRMWGLAAGLLAVAFAVPNFMGHGLGTLPVFFVLFGLFVLLDCGGRAFWFPMLHDLIPEEIRGRFLGRLRATWSTTSFVFILLSGLFLGRHPELWRFQVVFYLAISLYVVRLFTIRHIPTGNSLAGDLDFDNWRQYVRGLFRQRALLVFLAYYGSLSFCMGFLGQPLVLYMKQKGFPAANNIIIYSFNTTGMILSFLFAGILVDRFGTKRMFLSAHLILFAAALSVVGIGMLSNESAQWLLPMAMVLSGGTIAASGIACTAQLFHLVPDRGRAFYLSLSLIVTGLGAAISPLLVGRILDVVPLGWCIKGGNMRLDLFQVILIVAAALILAVIVWLRFVENVHLGKRETFSEKSHMEYRIAKRSAAPKETDGWDSPYWSGVPELRVEQFRPEGSDHRPEVGTKLTHSGDAIHVFFRVKDRYVRSVYTQYNDSVCRDSCVEFFVQPRGVGPYFNVEINCGGTMLLYFVEDPTRPDMHSSMAKCTPVRPELARKIAIRPSMPKTVEPEITEPVEWTLQYTLPVSVLEEYVGSLAPLDGQTWRANFFKCADKTSHPHWASWSPVGGALNFHQPEYFAPIVFER